MVPAGRSQGLLAAIDKRTPRRIGEGQDMIGLAVFMASDEASYMTGSIVRHGGWRLDDIRVSLVQLGGISSRFFLMPGAGSGRGAGTPPSRRSFWIQHLGSETF